MMHLVSFVRTDRNMVLDVSVRQYYYYWCFVAKLWTEWVYLSSDSSLCVCVCLRDITECFQHIPISIDMSVSVTYER